VLQALREAAAEGYAVLFLDEIESIGRIRGAVANQHSDKFLAAFLAELDGFTDRSRGRDRSRRRTARPVDPATARAALRLEVAVGRPDLHGARDIFAIHLPASLPARTSGTTSSSTSPSRASTAERRQRGRDAAFPRRHDPPVAARHLASGRLIEQICRAARRIAFERDVRTASTGCASPTWRRDRGGNRAPRDGG
jgi:SpoVK/Ycf46/Vps4 family AAA+-type ATPase